MGHPNYGGVTLRRAGPNLSARYHYPPSRRISVEDFWVAKAVIPSFPKSSNPKTMWARWGTIQNNNFTQWGKKKGTRWVTQKNILNQDIFTAEK